jgi:D-arabinose 1-dehydrogenase-like Zn-dependent alcohol dehydrogenase
MAGTLRAVVYEAARKFEIKEVRRPPPSAGEVLPAVATAGMGGT